jgi:hypothetical protein
METKFQTSFIPKKPMPSVGGATTPQHHHGTSLFMTIAVFLFIASLAAAGGAYAWKGILKNAQASYKQQLADRERAFQVNLIEKLKQTNIQIDTASKLLENHLAISQIFDVISRFTISNVQFRSMELTYNPLESGKNIQIEMEGVGTTLAAVAFQSDVLSQLEQYGLRKVVKNPALSNPSFGANSEVTFGFSAEIDPEALTYAKAVNGEIPSDESLNSTGTSQSSVQQTVQPSTLPTTTLPPFMPTIPTN